MMNADDKLAARIRRRDTYINQNPERASLVHARNTPAINSEPKPEGYKAPKKPHTVVDNKVREGKRLHVSIYNDRTRVMKQTYTVTKVTPSGLVRTDKGATFKLDAQGKVTLYDAWMKDVANRVTCNVL